MASAFLSVDSVSCNPTLITSIVALFFSLNQTALVNPNSSFGLITNCTPDLSNLLLFSEKLIFDVRNKKIDGINVCGKTGTVENYKGGVKQKNHSVFIAFAPMEDPKIAIAVFVENAGYGGTWAAPIAGLMMEKYLKKSISNPEKEKRVLDAKLNNK